MGRSVKREGKPQGKPAGRQRPVGEAYAVIFHVRAAAPVKELVAAMHASATPTRSPSGRTRDGDTTSGRTARPRDEGHPPLYLVDNDHLIALAPSRASARTWRRALERALDDAVEYVETQSVTRPRVAAGGRPRPRARR